MNLRKCVDCAVMERRFNGRKCDAFRKKLGISGRPSGATLPWLPSEDGCWHPRGTIFIYDEKVVDERKE